MVFITLRYADNEFLLLNPNCSNRIFIDYISSKCKLDQKGTFDLVDENGVTAELFSKEPNENIASFFTPRAMYILASIELNEDKSIKKITPLLQDWEKKFPFLERKLKHRDKKQARLSSDPGSPDSPSPKDTSKLNRKRSERTSHSNRTDSGKDTGLSPASGELSGGSVRKMVARTRKMSKR